jgi:hypothetical protein
VSLELQAVADGVAQAMRGVHQPEPAQDDHGEPGQRVAQQRVDLGVGRRVEPTERERDAEEEEHHRHGKRGHYPAGAEKQPQERLR